MLTKQNSVKYHNYITILPDIDDVNLTLGEIVLRKIINNIFINSIDLLRVTLKRHLKEKYLISRSIYFCEISQHE